MFLLPSLSVWWTIKIKLGPFRESKGKRRERERERERLRQLISWYNSKRERSRSKTTEKRAQGIWDLVFLSIASSLFSTATPRIATTTTFLDSSFFFSLSAWTTFFSESLTLTGTNQTNPFVFSSLFLDSILLV